MPRALRSDYAGQIYHAWEQIKGSGTPAPFFDVAGSRYVRVMPNETANLVIPVLDLMIGQIVLAQGGDRGNYLPVQSRLTNSSRPLDVAKALFQQTGSNELYLADIDSFAGAKPNWRVYNEILDFGFSLIVDADWITNDRFEQIPEKIARHDNLKVIFSSETLSGEEDFGKFRQAFDAGLSPIFSLDLRSDALITKPGSLESTEPTRLISLAYEHGVRAVIVLDVSMVGTLKGGASDASPSVALIQQIQKDFPELSVISGGGVGNLEDIQAWLDVGCQQVLVASAIHHCKITPFDVANLSGKFAKS